jgi:drug/metabolite transporter superfamily protein YnfA
MAAVGRGMVFDGFRPDRYDITGALIRLAGSP